MKYKSEVVDIFLKFKAWVEKQSTYKIQVIRLDNGTKYISEKFNNFNKKEGIEHHLTAPYTPQQNKVVERKNRTLVEMARCLLHDKGLPKNLWAKVANTTIFLLNILPTKALQQKTSFKAWYGYKPKLQNLKTFGCLCFSYTSQVKKDKLDKKAEPRIFVGYSSVSEAYMIYLPQDNKVIVGINIQFFESESWS
jgi:transposase InsO family protein